VNAVTRVPSGPLNRIFFTTAIFGPNPDSSTKNAWRLTKSSHFVWHNQFFSHHIPVSLIILGAGVWQTMQSSSDPVEKLAQQIALAIVPKVTASLSILAESWIVVEVSMCPYKRHQVYHRLLLGFALTDLLQTIWFFASTWPIPRGTTFVYGNVGNQASCTAQGFFIQLGEAVPFYFCSLIIYYYLAIRLGLQEKAIRVHWEKYLHIVPVGFAFGSAMAGLFLGLYNTAGSWCWIAPLPWNCLRDPDVHCVRGQHAKSFQFVFSFVPMWVCALVVLLCLARIYACVRHHEIKSRRYRNIHVENGSEIDDDAVHGNCFQRICGWDHCPQTGQVASQALYYVAAFYFAYSFGTLNRLITLFSTSKEPVVAVQLLQAFFQPLQGVFNFLIYRRPTYLRLRKNEQLSRFSALLRMFRWSFLDGGNQNLQSLFIRVSERVQSRYASTETSIQSQTIPDIEMRICNLARTDIIEDVDGWMPCRQPAANTEQIQETAHSGAQEMPVARTCKERGSVVEESKPRPTS
jgi:hypothetical protein